MTDINYQIIDADAHFYEPDDCFTRHIESQYKDKTVWIDRKEHNGRVYLGDERLNFFSVAVGDHVGPPGAMKAFFKGTTERGAVNLNPINANDVPAFVNREARLTLMDEQNVEACFMLPTFGVGVEQQLRNDKHRELLYPTLRSFNRWAEEDWGFGKDGRIFSAAILSLMDINEAVKELDRLIACGCKLVILPPGPFGGKSPADPEFNPFWARAEEAGVSIVYHIGASKFCEMYAAPWGETAVTPPSHRFSALQIHLGLGARPVADTFAALILHNLFDRFPKLNIISIENGSEWAKPLIKNLDKLVRMENQDTWRFGKPSLKPSEYFQRNIFIAPYYEDDIPALVDTIGASQILNGSDFPHPEGLEWPMEFSEELEGLDKKTIKQIMRDNSAAIIGLK